jgi:O-acetylserine/cysteine efflux transporter
MAATALRVPWPRLSLPVLGAGVMFGLHQLLFIGASKRTSIAIVTLVAALQPLLVALVSRRALDEPVPRRLLGFTGLAVAGVALVVAANLDDPSRTLAGDVLSVVNLVVFTAYFLFSKTARGAGAPALTFTGAVFIVALLVQVPALLLSGISPLGGVRLPTLGELGLLFVLAMVPGNGHLLVNWAHNRVTAALSSLVLALVPLLASVWAHLVFGEPYGWRHVAGMLLVVAAIEGGRRVERRRALEAAALAPVE